MTELAVKSVAPDGFQIIDVTTGEQIYHDENEILTWQLASHYLAKLPSNGQYVIIAVTEDWVLKQSDVRSIRYLPEFFSFSFSSTKSGTENGVYTTVVHSPLPNSAENEVCFNPRITRHLFRLLGLPEEDKYEHEQRVWSLDLVRDRLSATEKQGLDLDDDVAEALAELRWFIDKAEDQDYLDLLIMDYNGFDLRNLNQ